MARAAIRPRRPAPHSHDRCPSCSFCYHRERVSRDREHLRDGDVSVVALLLAAATVSPPPAVVVPLAGGDKAEWRRGEAPALLVLPRAGDGWTQIAIRFTGGRADAETLREANPGIAHPVRNVHVLVPWSVLRGELRVAVVWALFPEDRRTAAGWEHVIVAPWGGDGESWWEMAEWWCGAGSSYPALWQANPSLGLFPPKGSRVLIPEALLLPAFREVKPGTRPAAVVATATPGPQPTAAVVATAPAPRATPWIAPPGGPSLLEYRGGEAVYRLRQGEALYSAVVVRFTGQLHAADVNATAREIARRSGIANVSSIPVGYPVRIPLDLLLPEYLPPDNPRRIAWEQEREELAAIKRVIHAANLEGIHIILDAGHGGGDSGAVAGDVWESTYTYDVMARLKRVLERETRATVWATVQNVQRGDPPDVDELPISRSQRLLVTPPYDLADPGTGVKLRWVLANDILERLRRQGVNPERVVFVSIHADSLHPSVRGMMVYVPSHSLRPVRGPNPRAFWDCREARETAAPRFPAAFRSRSEALSTQLGDAIVRAAERYSIPVHEFEPVRSSVLRGGSRWVPAVLRDTRVPTAVLIEICNLNNEEDRALLLNWRFREKLAHAIAAGLAEGFSR